MENGKPLILLTLDSNNRTIQPGEFRQMKNPKAYFDAVAASGGIPVAAGEHCAEELAQICDALLLTGGDDLEPALYGEELRSDTVKTDPVRDEFEMPLTRYFIEMEKPILGICRGIQTLNVALGGTVYQDVVEDLGSTHMNPKMRHPVTALPGSFFYNTFGETFRVNSTHHQACKDLGEGLVAVCRSVDGSIEAFEHESKPFLGTQFHPERMTGERYDGTTLNFKPVFDHFVALAIENAQKRGEG